MKSVFCSQCGQELPITRKALPSYNRVVDLINPHVCGEVVEINWEKSPLPTVSNEKEFVKKLNGLEPKQRENLRDLREISHEPVMSTPENILRHLKNI